MSDELKACRACEDAANLASKSVDLYSGNRACALYVANAIKSSCRHAMLAAAPRPEGDKQGGNNEREGRDK